MFLDNSDQAICALEQYVVHVHFLNSYWASILVLLPKILQISYFIQVVKTLSNNGDCY